MMMYDKLSRKMMVFKHTQNWNSHNDGSWTVSGSEFYKVGPSDQKQQRFFVRISSFWDEVLQCRHALQMVGDLIVQMRIHNKNHVHISVR